jgi:COP9 signalosome complex subunit 12
MRSLQATASDMPSLEQFPKSHQVTFNYYAGVISFLEEDYAKVSVCKLGCYN